jgi:PAS domain S-box-containing protein
VITRFNHAFEDLTLISAQEIIGQRLDLLFPKDSRDTSLLQIKKTLEGERWEIVEIPILVKDGSIRTLLWNSANIHDPDGRIISTIAQGVDITERKRVEKDLYESQERYNSLFTNNYSISLLIDPETGKIVDANAAACKYYGYSHEQIRGMGIYEINRIEKEIVIRNLKEAKKEKERHFFSTHFLSDGRQRNVEIYSGSILVNGKTLFYSIIHDVTDRVKAEEELKNSRRFIDHTLATTPALIYIYDVVEGRNVYTNRGIFEALGYTPEEISSMGQDLFSKILHPDDAGQVGQHHARFSILPDSTIAEIEYRMKHSDGSWRWLHSRDVVFQRTPDGAVKQILGSSIDITDRKRAEEALIKSEEKYRILIEQTDEGVWIVGSDYKTTFVNDRLAAMFEYTPQEMIGKKVQEFMPAEDMEVHSKRVRERLEGKGDRFEQKYIRKDGSVFWVIASVTPLLAEENRFEGAFAMLTDITERKVAEEALRESEERYRAVADFTYDWEYWMALDGKFVYVSPSCERITGYRPEEFIVDPNLLVTITHADDRDKIIEHLALGKKVKTEHGTLEFRIITRNGEERWIGHECQPVFNTNGGYLGRRGSNRDITERKRAEENLIATIKRTRDQQDMLGTISLSPFLFSGDVQGLSVILTEVSSGVLGVDRVSVWLFNNNEDELRCIDLYEVLYGRHSYDGVLKRHEYVNEFDALSTAKYIDAHDPLTDPRTAGYIEDYLKPNHITSMLDAVIRVSGQNLGVLCFEHVDRPHHWESDEISFACQLADQIAITLLNRDRKLAEEALLESEERYRNVVEDQTEFICRFLPDGTHIFVNDAYCRYFDKKREEIIGQRFKPLLHTEDREMVTRHLASLTPEHPVEDIDQRIIMPDDSLKWQRWSDRAIFDPNGRVIEYQSVGRDITEQKELEKEMEYHEQELRKYSTSLTVANKKLNLLSSITRHDITNQLTVLVGYLRILQKNQPDPSFNDYFQKIATASQRISSMIQFTKEYENIGVNAPIWQDCRTLIDTTAKQVQLGTFTVKNDLPSGAEVFADPLISKVFYNLMDNAVRYGNKITTIRFSVEESGNDPVIVCEDDGDGVVAEEKERIFERGFGKNTGLGLALVREILSITGITIRETGEPGKGARFEMTLPKGAWRMKGKDA